MRATPSQTIGPFFRVGLTWFHGHQLVEPGFPGAITLGGRIFDGAGDPVPDAVVEIQQAGPSGDPPPRWRGFGRCCADPAGVYEFLTVKPGPLDDGQAPHIEVAVFARGLMQRCWTRCYFPDEQVANRADPVLRQLPDAGRLSSLIAVAEGDRLRFDICLQGARETVFFEW